MDDKNILIYTNQGYTDIICCIGLIFYNLEKYKNVTVLLRSDVENMFRFIFRNIKCNFIFKPFDEVHPNNVKPLLNKLKNKFSLLIYGPSSGYHNKYEPICNANFFYTCYCKYPISNKNAYLYFNIERDHKLEDKIYKKHIKKYGKDYIIINDDLNRNKNESRALSSGINNKYFINKDLPVFNINNSSKVVFDMIKIIENAKEIHLTSTFWSLIIYYLQLKFDLFKDIKIFLHSYVIPSRIYCDKIKARFDDGLYKEFGSNWIFLEKI
jgi:hypothetical protein